MAVETGLTRLARGEAAVRVLLSGARVGLLAHPASVDAELCHAAQILPRQGARLVRLFGPEHGYDGRAQDMIGVGDAGGAIRVHSLYGESFADLSPRPEWLEGLDAVVIDLQDVGARYYTFVWSAALMLLACAQQGIRTIVLDRPNPLGGEILEGAPQRPGYRSFVGLYDVPVRHGMTLGEICQMVAVLEALPSEALCVVPVSGYARQMSWADTGQPWVLPSPNMPTPDTALVYPGGCLVEGTNLSEGRGTTRPFEIFGAPFVNGEAVAAKVSAEGATLRPLTFQPTFHKHAGRPCGGLQVHVRDVTTFRPYALYRRLLAEIASQARGAFAWRTEVYEYVSDRPAIDLLTGGAELRLAVAAGQAGEALQALEVEDERACAAFRVRREPWLLYR